MAQVTAATVKELRERTGAGMMDCKKALAETDGDMEASVDWLRAKGLAAAPQEAGRVAGGGAGGGAGTGRDREGARDGLRARGLAAAAKKSGRVAAEGLVGVAVDGTRGAVIEVNS